MYRIIATDDFVDVIRDLSLKHLNVLTNSFISIERIENVKNLKQDFLEDLMEQMHNQELE